MSNFIPKEMKEFLAQGEPDMTIHNIAVEELEKFLYLRSKNGPAFISVTPKVDDLWHKYILQTREYHNLCEKLPSGEYIHHKTIAFNDHFKNNEQKAEFYKSQAKEVSDYIDEFGDFNEETCLHWGLTKYLRENNIMTVKEINRKDTWQSYLD